MDAKGNLIEPLLERAEAYSKTTFELEKLKLLNKGANLLSMMIFHFLAVVFGLFFALAVTVAISFWLGELLGKLYLGFLITASFNALVCVLLFFVSPGIKGRIYNSVLKNILN